MDKQEKTTEVSKAGQTGRQLSTSTRPQIKPESVKWRAVKIKSFYGGFFQRDLGELEMLQVSETVELLAVFTNEEIKTGLMEYQISGPRNATGYLRKPAPGDLYNFLMVIRGKAMIAENPRAEMPNAVKDTTPVNLKPIDPERKAQADQILKDAGFAMRSGK